MKGLALIVFIGLCGLVYSKPGETYTDKFDNINIDEILKNDRLLENYRNCISDKGKCTKDGEELKKNIPDAIQNGCSKCTDAQKRGTKKVIFFLIKEKRSWWNELQKKYDPENKYIETYADELKKEGITL